MAVRRRKTDSDTTEASSNVIEAPIVPRRLGVNDILKARRIECGIDLPHVAEVLRIRQAVLFAIEEGKFDELPGSVYAVGFVRSYAAYLGLDADALVARFKIETADASQRPHLNFPLPISDRRVPTGPLVIVCVLLAAVTYVGWLYVSEGRSKFVESIPAVPERLRHLLSAQQFEKQTVAEGTVLSQAAPATAAALQPAALQPTQAVQLAPVGQAAPAAQAAAPITAAVASPQPPAVSVVQAPSVDGVPPVEDKSAAAQPAAALPASPDLAQPALGTEGGKAQGQGSYGVAETDARVVLNATADSWVQVRDKGGNLLFTRMLKPGERYNAPNQPGLTMVVGNAGGLAIAVDGTAVAPVGELGHVARNVSLDPERLLAGKPRAN